MSPYFYTVGFIVCMNVTGDIERNSYFPELQKLKVFVFHKPKCYLFSQLRLAKFINRQGSEWRILCQVELQWFWMIENIWDRLEDSYTSHPTTSYSFFRAVSGSNRACIESWFNLTNFKINVVSLLEKAWKGTRIT